MSRGRIVPIDFILEYVQRDEEGNKIESHQESYPGEFNIDTGEVSSANDQDDPWEDGLAIERRLMKMPSGVEVEIVWDNMNQTYRIKEDDENDEYE